MNSLATRREKLLWTNERTQVNSDRSRREEEEEKEIEMKKTTTTTTKRRKLERQRKRHDAHCATNSIEIKGTHRREQTSPVEYKYTRTTKSPVS